MTQERLSNTFFFYFLVGVTRSIEMLFAHAWMMIHVEIQRIIH